MDITAFTIALSFIGIVISIVGLTISLVFLVNVFKLSKEVEQIEEIKEILISSLAFYMENGEMISGRKALNLLKEKYDCKSDLEAIRFYYYKEQSK